MPTTVAEKAELQAVFKLAAETLGERVLRGKHLEWRPSKFEMVKSAIVTGKNKFREEYKKFSGGSTPPVTSWQKTTPSSATRSGVVIGAQRTQNKLLSDARSAFKKGGGGTAKADIVALMKEGANAIAEQQIQKAVGGEPSEQAVHLFADMVVDSGLVDAALVGNAETLVIEVLNVLPIIGAVTNLSSGACNGIRTAMAQWKIRTLDQNRAVITPGLPRASLEAVRSLLERKRSEYAAYAGMDLAAGSAQLAGLFADVGVLTGPAVGIAKAAGKLAVTLIKVMTDFREFRAGNEQIMSGPYDDSLISACPLLGSYLITEAESSTLYAYLAENRLPLNWMDDIDALKPKIDDVIRVANACQHAAPYVLKGHVARLGTPNGAQLKSAHFLDFRWHKSAQRLAHEAKLILKRDPRGLRFLGKQVRAKLGI
jgi:hypothetical protein